MISSASLWYLVASICLMILTGFLVALSIQMLQVLRDVSRISHNLERISFLLEKVTLAFFPGLEKTADNLGKTGESVSEAGHKFAQFIEEKVDSFTNQHHNK